MVPGSAYNFLVALETCNTNIQWNMRRIERTFDIRHGLALFLWHSGRSGGGQGAVRGASSLQAVQDCVRPTYLAMAVPVESLWHSI